MSKFLCIPRVRTNSMSDDEIISRIRVISHFCSTNVSNETEFRANNNKALRGLIDILRNSNRHQLQFIGPNDVISFSIKILSNYADLLRTEMMLCDTKRRRDYKIALICYYDLLKSFVPEKSREFVCSFVNVVHKERLWQWEHLCWILTGGLLEHGVEGSIVVNELLDRVEKDKIDLNDARAIVRILYEILEEYSWPENHDTVLTIERLLNLYYVSLRDVEDDNLSFYTSLKRGLEVCIRHTIKNLTNQHLLVVVNNMCTWSIRDKTSDTTILDFGGILEYAAHKHDTRLYKDTLTSELFPILMEMIRSSSRLVSLLGNRVVHHLLDRSGNRSQFATPMIFFESMNFGVRINRYDKEDKYFLQANREILHDSLVHGVMRHSSSRLNLESVYSTMCLIAVEVPCGFTAAALVCLVMNIQDLTIERKDISRDVSSHIHATVMSIMSLLCWIHEAKVFYAYVNKIMMLRAQWAPHLNPPIKSHYSFATHHILWNKPELFFVDWEARYGLWKCFRLRGKQRSSTDDHRSKTDR